MMRVGNEGYRVGVLHSLRTQLFIGTVLLLAATVSVVGYFLIIHQKHTLTAEMEKTVILQGRNVALSSAKPLLRPDPEFELYPLVGRLLKDVEQIDFINIVDRAGIVHGHAELVRISKPLDIDMAGFAPCASLLARGDERLYEDADTYLFVTPVLSAEQPVGSVYLAYSKKDLAAGLRQALRLAIVISAIALIAGLGLALAFFERISRPLSVMMKGAERLGTGDLATTIAMPTNNEFRVLAASFNDMARRIARAQGELVAKERMDRELEIAREIQGSLIPTSVTPPPGYEIGHYYQSATAVGGDYLDVIAMSPNRVGLVVADVSGKGVPGLVVMAMVKVLTRELLTSGNSPAGVLRNLNSAVQKHIGKNMFVTLFLAILDTDTGTLVCTNAGHNPVLIYDHDADSVRFFKMAGVPLGVFDGASFDATVRDYHLALKPGDVVLQYTDGLNESKGENGERLKLSGIETVARRCAGRGARVLVQELVREESGFRGNTSQYDDIALLALGLVGTPLAAGREAVVEEVAVR